MDEVANRELSTSRRFPWLRLFQVPGAAANPRRLILAAVGLLLTQMGWEGLDRVFTQTIAVTPDRVPAWEWEAVDPSRPADLITRVAEPFALLTAPFRREFSMGNDPATFAHAGLAALWVVVVWGLIGGALARIAVVDVARHERVSLSRAVRFAWKKWAPLIGTPLIPIVGVVVVGSLIAGFGLLYRVPGGPTVAGALAILPLLGGLLLTLILIGLGAGWPLMHAAVAAEAEDGFDAMSRSYAYVYQRPWLYAAYAALAALVGCVGLVLFQTFVGLVTHLTAWALALGGPPEVVATLFGDGQEKVAASASATHGVWLGVIGLVTRAWVHSAFWTAAAVIYLLLRRDVDGKPIVAIAYEAPISPLLQAAAEASLRRAPSPNAEPRREPAADAAGPHSHSPSAEPEENPA
ncbi:MAG: hypothetical protein AB7I30_17805 [Isosphaeraceae bacterium]